MSTFRAFRVHEEEGRVLGRLEDVTLDDLSPGEVVLRAEWSDVNYKDALAATGKGKIVRKFPRVIGIDVAGIVESSADERFRPGDPVLTHAQSLGETHDGGYAERVRVPAEWVVPLPEGLSAREAMALGTAGFTAAMAVEDLEHNGLRPESGPVLVTGATGGVGSFAIDLLATRGYAVTALTGKPESEDYLRRLGARELLLRADLEELLAKETRPLEKARWAGAVDNVGGKTLSWLTRTVGPRGAIASIGLAGGVALETTVLPFILRGIKLLGINCLDMPNAERTRIWNRLATDLRPRRIEEIVTRTVGLGELPAVFEEILAGKVTGRTLVRIGGGVEE